MEEFVKANFVYPQTHMSRMGLVISIVSLGYFDLGICHYLWVKLYKLLLYNYMAPHSVSTINGHQAIKLTSVN